MSSLVRNYTLLYLFIVEVVFLNFIIRPTGKHLNNIFKNKLLNKLISYVKTFKQVRSYL